MNDHEPSVQDHYSSGDLLARILAALEEDGKPLQGLTPRELAAVDQFHTRGLAATRELAALLEPAPGMRVLDVGSGLGGPARVLAVEFGCDVTGIDLVPEFCAVANDLSRRIGLAARTRFQVGDALGLPFEDGAFERVWTFQAQMNIADKTRFYGEIARVLRPGGRLAFQDILAGNGAPLDFPVPWATRPEQSHLAEPEAVRGMLAGLGLQEVTWRDVSDDVVAWRAKQHQRAAPPGAPPPKLGIHLVLGGRAADKQRNTAHNLDEGRIVFVQGVFDKAA